MNMIIDNELLLNQERIACLCVCAVIAHLLASRFLGAKVQVFPQLKISVWRAYLTKCADNNVVNCLKFGWPVNYGSAFCRLLLGRISSRLTPMPTMSTIICRSNDLSE